jgi:hypothetical protein
MICQGTALPQGCTTLVRRGKPFLISHALVSKQSIAVSRVQIDGLEPLKLSDVILPIVADYYPHNEQQQDTETHNVYS